MFKITIEETKDVRKTIGKRWDVIKREGDHYEHGYAPEVETIVTDTVEIYQQVVEDLDLIAVIEAVNKIKK